MKPFVARYPAFLAGSAEFRDIQEALEPELLDLWSARDGALAQLCVETACGTGRKPWASPWTRESTWIPAGAASG